MCLQNKHPCNCNFSPMNKHIILRYEKALYYYVEIKTTNKAGSKHNKPFALVVPVIGQCKYTYNVRDQMKQTPYCTCTSVSTVLKNKRIPVQCLHKKTEAKTHH